MSTSIISRSDLKREYQLLNDSIQSILDLSGNACRSRGLDTVTAIYIIHNISQHIIRNTGKLDDVFIPDVDTTDIDGQIL